MAGVPRRGFLARCLKAAGAILIPAAFRRGALGLSNPEFHFFPHYRQRTALDTAVLQIKPGLDGFTREADHARIALILDGWSTALLHSPPSTQEIERTLSVQFVGTGWRPVGSSLLRPASSTLDVRRLRFSAQPQLTLETFIDELRSSFAVFARIVTAEFQVTGIEAGSTGFVTRVRYELVGTGEGFHREQRVGDWSLDWETGPNESYRIVRWISHEEGRSRSALPLYREITGNSFGRCSSYHTQLLHGADYWRTVLDGACGIDIYGHNGISVGDVFGSGGDDVYVCQPAGLPNRLYRNRGDGTFDDITESSGVGLLENTACALFADFDDDGRQDLVVVRANGPLLFLNQGNGKFKLKDGAFQFANPPQGTFTGAAAADYNRDGRLDIYFCLYTFYQGADQYNYPTPYFAAENGPPNFMMQNNGDGTFRDVTAQCGLDKNNTRYSFCCGWGDSSGDGWPDLYVVNDFGRKNLYRNNGDGTFRDVAADVGVEDVGAGMSVCWLDDGNDGAQDLYVANMWTAAGERITVDSRFQPQAPEQIQALYRKHAMGNSLFRNAGNAGFRDVTRESGTGMGRWAWSSDTFDFDHDGFPDIYIANGMISGANRVDLNSFFWRQVVAKSPNTARSSAEYEQGWNAINEFIRAGHSWSGLERNVLYANNHDGTFSDVSGALGLDFLEDGRAFAVADLDGDGRQEILIKNRNAPQLRVVKNVVPDLAPAIAFRLHGTKSNPDAIGAAVTIQTGVGRQTRMLQAGSGFLSQHSKDLFFGLGAAKGNVSATIRWPSGLVQELRDLPANHLISVTEGRKPDSEEFKGRPLETEAFVTGRVEPVPETVETWLLVPVSAPDFSLSDAQDKPWTLSALRGKPVLLHFAVEDLENFGALHGLQIVVLSMGGHTPRHSFPVLHASDEVAAIYNLLFRYLFDQHRDLAFPTSLLIDENGQVVKIYQGRIDPKSVEKDYRNIPRTAEERIERALPFTGVSTNFEFGRNYLSLGSLFFQRGYSEAAGEFFQSALRDDPSSAEAYYGVGSVYLKQAKNSQARECFEHTVKLKASYPETAPNAWNNLGLLAAREGETTIAVDYFERALQLDPDHFVTLQNLGNAYRQQKRWEEARATLERALALRPEDAEANYSLGMVYAQLEDVEHAYQYLQKALQSRPDYPEALNNLGVLYLRTRRRDDAVAAFEKCIRVAPAFEQCYLNLARVYAIEGDREKARAVLNALLTKHPDHAMARQALAQLQ